MNKKKQNSLRILITAGPTRAYLDRVRFITNYSTGELGFLLSKELTKTSLEVVAIVGPNHQPFIELPLKRLVQVETTEEMFEATLRECRQFKPDVAVFSAAVLDFKPKKIRQGKVSSQKQKWMIDLVPTPKIIDEVGEKFPHIKRIGFKLEWEILKENSMEQFAQKMIQKKKLTALCMNFLPQIKKKKHPITLFSSKMSPVQFQTKKEAARGIAQFIQQVGADSKRGF